MDSIEKILGDTYLKHDLHNYMNGFDNVVKELAIVIEKYIKREEIRMSSPSIYLVVWSNKKRDKIPSELIRDMLYTLRVKGEIAMCSSLIAIELNAKCRFEDDGF